MKIKQLGVLSATLLSGAAQADGPGGRPGDVRRRRRFYADRLRGYRRAAERGQTTFNPNQNGTYTVNSDCTGTMKILYTAGGAVPAGVETDLNIVVAADGSRVPDGLTLARALAMSGAEPVLERRFSVL